MNDDQRKTIQDALKPVITEILHQTHDDREREALFKEMAGEIKDRAATWIAEYEEGFRKGRASRQSGQR